MNQTIRKNHVLVVVYFYLKFNGVQFPKIELGSSQVTIMTVFYLKYNSHFTKIQNWFFYFLT